MDWRAHTAIGAAFAAAAAYILGARDFPELVFFAFFGALSALLPDLDHDQSKGRKILDSVVVLIALAVAYLYSCSGALCFPALDALYQAGVVFLIVMGAYFIAFKLFKPRHRGITHTLAACFVFGVLVYLAGGLVPAVAGSAGYFSHLLADRQLRVI